MGCASVDSRLFLLPRRSFANLSGAATFRPIHSRLNIPKSREKKFDCPFSPRQKGKCR